MSVSAATQAKPERYLQVCKRRYISNERVSTSFNRVTDCINQQADRSSAEFDPTWEIITS